MITLSNNKTNSKKKKDSKNKNDIDKTTKNKISKSESAIIKKEVKLVAITKNEQLKNNEIKMVSKKKISNSENSESTSIVKKKNTTFKDTSKNETTETNISKTNNQKSIDIQADSKLKNTEIEINNVSTSKTKTKDKMDTKIKSETKELKGKIKQDKLNDRNNIYRKIFNISSLVIKIIFLISFITNLLFLLKIDMLPTKYLSIFILLSSFILVFAILTQFILKNKVLKIISTFLSFIVILLYIFLYIYIRKTDTFINGLFNDEQLETYYLAVLSDSNYQTINDLKNLKIGTYYNNEGTYNEIIKIVNKTIEYDEKSYDNLIEMCNALISGEIDAILINDANKTIINENNELINIQLKYIYNVTTKTKINVIAKDLNVVDTPFIVYITGIDTYGEISSVARSDVNIVATINPKTKKILLVTIPRDYYVQLHNTTGNKDKLTHSGIYGIDMSVSTIEDLLDIDINYYIRLNFSTLINTVDVIGGIDVYSEYEFNTYGYQFYRGYNSVNGQYALAFSRARYNFANGDRTRGENQMRVIDAIINKMSSSRVLVTNYLNILNSLNGTFQTNIDSKRIYDLVKMQLSTMPKWQVETYSLNGYDSSNYTYSMGDMLLYVMEPDYSTIDEAKYKIQEFLNTK